MLKKGFEAPRQVFRLVVVQHVAGRRKHVLFNRANHAQALVELGLV